MAAKKRLLSGIQSTGRLHLGNYFGAMKQFVDFQDKYDTYVSVVNLHSLTTVQDPEELRRYTRDAVLDHLAIGLDPDKAAIFLQSSIPEVAELAWIFECLITMPYLERAHAYKDKIAKGIEPTVGLFNYPVLMAADILIVDGELVPVGEDQRQHVEIAREIARKFNQAYGDTFIEPKEYIPKEVAVVPGTDGQKMSKSYDNVIPLFGTDEEIQKSVMSIVTDSSGDMPKNVYAIHKLFRSESELENLYEEKKGNYKELKEALLADILALVSPMRTKREEYEKKPEKVDEILAEGTKKARAIVGEKMKIVRKSVGLA